MGKGGQGVFLLNSQYEPSRKSLAPTKEFMLHLLGGFFHFDFEVCPPPPSPTMPETTKNFFQHCDKQAKCQSLRTCWGYTTLFGEASKGRNISKYGGKKWRMHQLGNSGLLFIPTFEFPYLHLLLVDLFLFFSIPHFYQANTISE